PTDTTNYKTAGKTAQIDVLKASQTISFAPLANETFGDPDFAVSATASSGLSVSFTASGNCTISGSTVHITGAGSCTVTAQQAGNSNYKAAADVSQSFTINKAPVTVSITGGPFTYNGQPHAATVGLNPAISGYSVNYTGAATAYSLIGGESSGNKDKSYVC